MLSNKYEYLDANVINFINKQLCTRPSFSEERFRLWLEINDIESKNNPSAFVNKCFLRELKQGTFDKTEESEIEYVPNTTPMFEEMRRRGIKVTQPSMSIISATMSYLLNNSIITPEELVVLNQGIAQYLLDNKDTLSTDDYIDLMKKSKMLSGRLIDWELVDKETKIMIQEWRDLLEELRKEED